MNHKSKKKAAVFVLLSCLFVFNGCTFTTYSSNYAAAKKVQISGESGTQVFVNQQLVGTTPCEVNFKDVPDRQFTLKKEGYLDRVMYAGVSPIIEIGKMTPLPEIPEEVRRVECLPVKMDFEKGDILGTSRVGKETKNVRFGEDMKINSGALQKSGNKALSDLGVLPSSFDEEGVFDAKARPILHLEAEVLKIYTDLQYGPVKYTSSGLTMSFVSYDCTIDVFWRLLDRNDQPIFEKKVQGSEIGYQFEPKSKEDVVIGGEGGEYDPMDVAFEHSLYAFLSNDEVAEALKPQPEDAIDEAEGFEPIRLQRSAEVAEKGKEIGYSAKAVATIKVDDGHGSGCVISSDGYIVTNYHVARASEKLAVIIGEDTYEAELIRSHTATDLSLLKIEATGLAAIPFSEDDEINVGSDVYAIGTPADVNLGQTVSKGIISGKRKIYGVEMIQTDVSINSGSSGGALVRKDGKLVGVVNSKLVGVGVEGIGFAIPVRAVMEKLKLTY